MSTERVTPYQGKIILLSSHEEKRTAVLSRIRDIVLGPDFTPSSVVPNVNACAAALPAAEFSKILQKRNIEGHTALYWAIVNNRPQALEALDKFISGYYPSVCKDDLRDACVITSDHAIFSQLGLGIRCPSDQLQVHTCDELTNQFNVVLRIRMFQKRMRATATSSARGDTKLTYEFVAGGRIWWLRFHMPEFIKGIWRVEIGLCRHSHPARLNSVLVIEAHNRKPGSAVPPEALRIPLSLADTKFVALAPWLTPQGNLYPSNMARHISKELGDWVMHEKTKYVDDEGTLNAKLEIRLF
ncbi:uncharacterized protein F5891DRAFT_978644 [Suillus fuscotomentosus]|uniref:Uncharacterized protein n=1 Tax=Suillus fuscotomentosus TaxID=1912939 RepID=A0AAD4EC75_9AGAM|nr:uncharacterized protein F5891DRAFT_978644 [Suillus fuscotomentosus]KAG1902314.1 hypothetical protein F5891DRAFT_978644 [Suillus fuscotomentosus]